jgi:hypothetical protein
MLSTRSTTMPEQTTPSVKDTHSEAYELVWQLESLLKLTADCGEGMALSGTDVHGLLLPIEDKARRVLASIN